jgi:uncharacterized protein YoxC
MANNAQIPVAPQPDFALMSQNYQTLAIEVAKIPNTPQFTLSYTILARLDQMNDRLNTAVGGINDKLNGLNTTVEGINDRLNGLNGLNTTVEGINDGLNGLNTAVEGINTRLDAMSINTEYPNQVNVFKIMHTICEIDERGCLNFYLKGIPASFISTTFANWVFSSS